MTEVRELLYLWHPWFGLGISIHEVIDKSDGVVFRCSLSGADTDRCLEVPAWMFDRSACARVRVTADALCDVAALTILAGLLLHALNNCFHHRMRRFWAHQVSLATRISGEIHATPDEVATGASPCAAADRTVRRRTAESNRRHAGLVSPAEGDTSSSDRLDNTVVPGTRRQEPDWRDDGAQS